MHVHQQISSKFSFNLKFKEEPGGNKYNERKINHLINKFIDLNNAEMRETLLNLEIRIKKQLPCVALKIEEIMHSYYFNKDVLLSIFDFIFCKKKNSFSPSILAILPLVSKKFQHCSNVMIDKWILTGITPLNSQAMKNPSQAINHLAHHQIKKINFIFPPEFSIEGLKSLLRRFSNLQSLKLRGLDSIKLTNEALFNILDESPDLESFQLKGNYPNHYFSDRFTPSLKKNYSLRFLDIEGTNSNLGLIAILNKCVNLESIKIANLKMVLGALPLIDERPRLRSLNFLGNGITDDGLLLMLDKCTNLQSLNLKNTFLTDSGFLAILRKCTHLTSLNLSGCGISDKGLSVIAEHFRIEPMKSSNLQLLDLSFTQVTSTGFFGISNNFPNLQSFIFTKAQINYLDLSAIVKDLKSAFNSSGELK